MTDNNNNNNDEPIVVTFTSVSGEEFTSNRSMDFMMRGDINYRIVNGWRNFVYAHNQNADGNGGWLGYTPAPADFLRLWRENTMIPYTDHRGDEANYPFRDLWWVWALDEDVFVCEDCERPVCDEESFSINGDRTVCEGCYDSYAYCDDHDYYYYRDDTCYSCEEDRRYGSRLIRDYSERVEVVFHIVRAGRPTETLSLPGRTSVTGFELEMEANNADLEEMAEVINDSLGHLSIMKHDGSLSHGLELVTQPLALDFVRDHLDLGVLKRVADMGARSAQTTSCGLHVHLNRSYFTGRETSVYTLMRTLYDNSQQWRILAGRDNSTYANWGDTDGETRRALTVAKGTKRYPGRGLGGDRYVPMNTNNGATFEFRFFKGTLKPSTVLARVESIHALAHFAMAYTPSSIAKTGFTWEKFRNFTEDGDNTARYTHFNTYATQKGI